MVHLSDQPSGRKIPVNTAATAAVPPAEATAEELPRQEHVAGTQPAEPDWKEQAMRLQAEMDNFRKRQAQRADLAITQEKERLLKLILPIADNLARALQHADQDTRSLREGVELIYRETIRLLEQEGVTRIETVGQPFNPNLHHAIATVPADAEPGTIVEEVKPGYLLNGKLLRPAEVVVAR